MTRYEDEIDLKPYLLVIFRHWKHILLVAFAFGVAGLAYSLLQPHMYKATATILLTRSRATLELADQFPTVTEPIDNRSRMDAILSITQSDAIARNSLDSLGGALPEDINDLEAFRSRITVRSVGDAVQIIAMARDPDLAADIANAWARQATQAINLAYSGEQPLGDIDDQLDQARVAYTQAQTSLESFIGSNRLTTLESQVADTDAMIATVANTPSRRLAFYSDRKASMESFVVQAEALKAQLAPGGQSTAGLLGDALAVLFTRASSMGLLQNRTVEPTGQEVAPQISQPVLTLDVQLSELNAALDDPQAMAADLDQLINLAEEEMKAADQAITTLLNDLTINQRASQLEILTQQRQNLTIQIEQERARQLELTSDRDLAWKAYQALGQKQVEIRSASQAQSLVTIAGSAVPPDRPASRGTVTITLAATIVGVFLAFAWLLAASWWRSGKTDTE